MASKVLVKIPVNFGTQVGKCTTADIISASVSGANARAAATVVTTEIAPSLSNSSSDSSIISFNYDPSLRVTQLEQNIKFLKDQHHLMLTSLHHEVETLRQRNRDLQFQLVFSRGSLALVKSTPSSPEDDSKPQVVHSSKQVNVNTLQVEMLERDLAELRSSLSELKARNSSLENIIDEQKKVLENSTRPSATTDPADENPSDPELAFKLEEAEKVIRRLRRENDEQRRELAMIKANQSKMQTAGGSTVHPRPSSHWTQQQYHDQREYSDQPREQFRDQRDQRREVPQDLHYDHNEQPQGSRFPPLSTQKYWHNNGQRGRWNNSWESGRSAGGSRMLNQSLPSLPGIPMGSGSPNEIPHGNPSSAPFTLLSHGGGGRRGHRGNFRGDRGGNGRGNGAGQSGIRGHWDQNREHRGRDRDRNRDQQGFNE